jgi:maltoporin
MDSICISDEERELYQELTLAKALYKRLDDEITSDFNSSENNKRRRQEAETQIHEIGNRLSEPNKGGDPADD